MKTVFSNANETIHVFIQQKQHNGRSSNVFFEGKKIYSYGNHYLLGEFVENKQKKSAIWINDKGYSNTTAKHINSISSGSNHLTRLFWSLDEFNTINKLKEYFQKLKVARKPEKYIDLANYQFSNYRAQLEFWGKKPSKDALMLLELFNIPLKEAKDIENKRVRLEANRVIKAANKRVAERKKAHEKERDEFLLHKRNSVSTYVYGEELAYLRISKDGRNIETSMNILVSAKEALLLYTLIEAGKDIKGYVIDHYTVISINGELKIGCHNIPIDNVHEVGKRLKELNQQHGNETNNHP